VLHKCANPVCGAQFRYLHLGWLFEVEIHHFESIPSDGRARAWNSNRHVERWWLCECCAACISLQFDPRLGLVMVSSVQGSGQELNIAVQPSNPPSNPRSNPKTAAGIARILIRPLDLDGTVLTQRRARANFNAQRSEAA
jgi:hypothetical protein